VQVNIGSLSLSSNQNVQQTIVVCEDFDKRRRMYEILEKVRRKLLLATLSPLPFHMFSYL
jgi:hypothetical protein